MPRLLDALERETSPEVLGPLTHAIARLLGPEHDARLIRIAPTIRSPFRGVLVVAIAQLGTEASDAVLGAGARCAWRSLDRGRATDARSWAPLPPPSACL